MPENLPVEDPQDQPTGVPQTVLVAGLIVLLEGLAGVGAGLYILFNGHDEKGFSSVGTAVWFLILFGAVLAAGVGLLRGHRWGRGVGILTQLLLAPVMFALFGESDRPVWGMVLLALIVPAFVLLVSPKTSRWMEQRR